MGQVERRKRVVAMAPYERGWSNVELIKDCGIIPYLLYKNHACDVSMVGAGGESYPYLDTYVKGLRMELLPDGSQESKLAYLTEHAEKIDCLILRGPYQMNYAIARRYKQMNPGGRIYVGLDASSHWMDRFPWKDQEFAVFMEDCDVIATSCVAMQDYLNWKWPWKIEYIPNGYYEFEQNSVVKFEFREKENVILTVGRLGTVQKATQVLLEAFALAAEELSDWELRLIGTVEPGFDEYIRIYFERYPGLKERVHFIGQIADRKLLLQEYEKAKVFALSSIYEGGTPNVIAEALHAGCAIAITKIDAYEEAIADGQCGMAAEVGNPKGFSEMLKSLCQEEKLCRMSQKAREHVEQNLSMSHIVAKLYEMIFGGQ